MISRHSRPEMLRAWSDARRLERRLEVELAATGARETRGGPALGPRDQGAGLLRRPVTVHCTVRQSLERETATAVPKLLPPARLP